MTDEFEDAASTRKVYWAGRQWCVTDYGLETIDEHQYYVEGSLLGGLTESGEDMPPMAETLRHIGEKSWVDLEDLYAAFAIAVDVYRVDLPRGAIAEAIRHSREHRFVEKAFNRIKRDERRAGGRRDSIIDGADLVRIGDLADAELEAEIERGRDFMVIPDPNAPPGK